MPQFVKFPSIEGFHNVVKSVDHFLRMEPPLVWPCKDLSCEFHRGVMAYRGKIKLHGTNAGVTIEDGKFAAQSRSRLVSTESDNEGFAKWVASNSDYWSSLSNMTVFGEWCGPGIMKGTAVNKIPSKIFAVFAIQEKDNLVTLPSAIRVLMKEYPVGIWIIPWKGELFTVDFNSREGLKKTADKLSETVKEIEPCDPWVKSTFAVEGICEGMVFYPLIHPVPSETFGELAFKAKGKEHAVVQVKEAVQVDPEVATSIEGFVAMFVTEARLEQWSQSVGLSIKKTGPFLAAFCSDVEKESRDELVASGLTWEQVNKPVGFTARTWFLAKCKEIV